MKKSLRLYALFACLSSCLHAAPVALDTLPKLIDYKNPAVSAADLQSGDFVEVWVEINEHGYVTDVSIKSATDPKLGAASARAVRHWRYAPAMSQGQATSARFVQPLRFGADDVTSVSIAGAPAKVRRKVSPIVPEGFEHATAEVTVALAIDDTGKVTEAAVVSSSVEELNEATLAAARQWTFAPAIDRDQAVSSRVYVPFHYVGQPARPVQTETVAQLADNETLTPVRQVNPRLNAELSRLDGEVQIALTVDPRGFVSEATVAHASHEGLGEAALAAVRQWRFKPVVKDGQPIAIRARQPFVFANGGQVAVAEVDRLPRIRRTAQPNLPAELEGVQGYARVVFDLDEFGGVASATVNETSHEVFAAPAIEAAKAWRFAPAVKDGKPTRARVVVPFVFGRD